MKFFVTIFAFLVVISHSAQTSYQVMHVKGKIYNESSKKHISLGDEIFENDLLKIETEGANCFIITPSKVKKTLSANTFNSQGKVDVLFAEVPNRSAITSRGDEEEGIVKFSDYFIGKNYIIFDSCEVITLNNNYFDSLQPSQFVIKYANESGASQNFPLKDKVTSLIFAYL
jgi:hypothetical protein